MKESIVEKINKLRFWLFKNGWGQIRELPDRMAAQSTLCGTSCVPGTSFQEMFYDLLDHVDTFYSVPIWCHGNVEKEWEDSGWYYRKFYPCLAGSQESREIGYQLEAEYREAEKIRAQTYEQMRDDLKEAFDCFTSRREKDKLADLIRALQTENQELWRWKESHESV